MPDSSGPWDGLPWAEADWFRHMTAAVPSGVLGTAQASATAGPLAWSASGLTITPAAGQANVGGAGYSRVPVLTSITATANTHASQNRIDRLVLRRSTATHTIVPAIITGAPAATPVAPAISRDATTWDLPLYSFTVPPASGTAISSIVDERSWVDPVGRATFVQATAPAYAPDGSIWFQTP